MWKLRTLMSVLLLELSAITINGTCICRTTWLIVCNGPSDDLESASVQLWCSQHAVQLTANNSKSLHCSQNVTKNFPSLTIVHLDNANSCRCFRTVKSLNCNRCRCRDEQTDSFTQTARTTDRTGMTVIPKRSVVRTTTVSAEDFASSTISETHSSAGASSTDIAIAVIVPVLVGLFVIVVIVTIRIRQRQRQELSYVMCTAKGPGRPFSPSTIPTSFLDRPIEDKRLSSCSATDRYLY